MTISIKSLILLFVLCLVTGGTDVSGQTIRIKGADATVENKNDQKVLIVVPDKDDTAEFLIENGTDVNPKTKIMIIAELFIKKGTKVNDKGNSDQYSFKVDKDHSEIANLLIFNGDVNVKNKNGQTALLFATDKCYIEIAKLLIENGADLDVKNKNGQTALMVATGNGCREIAELLKKAGTK